MCFMEDEVSCRYPGLYTYWAIPGSISCDLLCKITAELHLSWLIASASLPYMAKIRIIGFLFENSLQWHFEVEKKIYKQLF